MGPIAVGAGASVEAPGQLPQHYAPRTRAVLLSAPLAEISAEHLATVVGDRRVALMRVVGPAVAPIGLEPVVVRTLSEGGDLGEAARALFRGAEGARRGGRRT